MKSTTEQLALRGSQVATWRKANEATQPEAVFAPPSPPSWLSEAGIRVWNEHAEATFRSGVLTAPDVALFASWCETLAEYILRRDEVIAEGSTVEKSNYIGAHPSIKVRDDARAHLLALSKQMGLVPVARQGLKLDKPKDSPSASLFAKG